MEKLDQEKYVLDLGIKKEDIKNDNAHSIKLSPGDMSIHNPNIIHGSDPNFSSNWRIGLTLRIIPSTTFIDRENWKCVHMSGNKNKKMENNYVNRPLFDRNKHMVFDGYENYN
jgi:ectoine hydroxylase-related dioxygenase (phytanoyl-CoA dioxygenase family)